MITTVSLYRVKFEDSEEPNLSDLSQSLAAAQLACTMAVSGEESPELSSYSYECTLLPKSNSITVRTKLSFTGLSVSVCLSLTHSHSTLLLRLGPITASRAKTWTSSDSVVRDDDIE